MSNGKRIKTEHSGAKNGGGYWGPREEAKKHSKKIRKEADKRSTEDSNGITKIPCEDLPQSS